MWAARRAMVAVEMGIAAVEMGRGMAVVKRVVGGAVTARVAVARERVGSGAPSQADQAAEGTTVAVGMGTVGTAMARVVAMRA